MDLGNQPFPPAGLAPVRQMTMKLISWEEYRKAWQQRQPEGQNDREAAIISAWGDLLCSPSFQKQVVDGRPHVLFTTSTADVFSEVSTVRYQ